MARVNRPSTQAGISSPDAIAQRNAAALSGEGTDAPVRRGPDARLLVSVAQQRMWFHHQLHPDSVAYHEPWAVELAGEVDAEALNAALVQLLERHPVLRSAFPSLHGAPGVVLHDTPVHVLTVEQVPSGEAAQAAIDRRIHEESTRPFKLEEGPLYRFLLLKGGPGCTVFLVVFHHIVMDGWSLNVLWRELGQAYAARCNGRVPQLVTPGLDYFDVVAWQQSGSRESFYREQLEYWTSALAGVPEVLELPTDLPRPAVLSARGGRTRRVALSSGLRTALSGFCRTHRVTPYMVLSAAFTALLQRYTPQRDLCLGMTAACRTTPEVQDVVGLFVNTCALRIRGGPAQNFIDRVREVRAAVLGAWSHQEVPFDQVVDALRIPRTLDHAPLVQAMVTLHKEEFSLADALEPALARPYPVPRHGTAFELTLAALETTRGLELELEFNADLYEAATAQRMLGHYLQLLDAALLAPAEPLQKLPLLTAAERQRVLVEFNDTSRPFDTTATVTSLFRAQVERTPDAVAVVAPDATLTFRELDERSTRLAHHLASLGARPETIVALCLERTSELLIGLWAILKTGAAYLPLEPTHPAPRRARLAIQAGASFIVGRPASFEGVELPIPLVSPGDSSGSAPLPAPVPESLAVVLYTSGSTGEPKGVELTHQHLVHAFTSFDDLSRVGPGHCWIACASVVFDMHLVDLVYPLSRGARIVLRDVGPAGLVADIDKHGVTHLVTTPSLLSWALEEHPGRDEALGSLSMILCGGEVLPPSLVQQLSSTRARVLNGYGPTETSIAVTAQEVRPGTRIGIGRAMERSTCYVLDDVGAPVPIGVPGELFVGGIGVSRGYRGRPDLTAERFLPDPFSPTPSARMYRTGDRVRWNEDGTLSFLGRADFQVKVRGVRIELEEVEAALLRIPGVQQAAALVRNRGEDARLDAWVVASGTSSGNQLRAQLARALPSAMVPSHVEVLEQLPLNANGKVDRRALQALPLTTAPEVGRVEPPAHGTEEAVAQHFCQVLGVSELGRDAHFFELGGNSLTAAQLAARLRQRFGIELTVATIFAHATVAELARAVEAAAPSTASGPPRRPESAPLVLSAAQERLWFLSRLLPDSIAYHVPQVIEFPGGVDIESLHTALRELLRRHPILRSIFVTADGRPTAVIQPVPDDVLPVETWDGAGSPSSEEIDAWARARASQPFSLERGPLHRFRLLRSASGHPALLLSFHHIVVDGLSIQQLLNELTRTYEAVRIGRSPELPAPALDFFDVAHWERAKAGSAGHDPHLEYWRRQLEGAPDRLELPTDHPRPSVLGDRGGVTGRVRLQPEVARELRAFCRKGRVTPFMALHAAFAALLHRHSGQEDFCVGTPVAGRHHPSTDGVVGLFVNTLALRTRFTDRTSFADLVRQGRETVLDALAHEELPFDRIVEALRIPRSLSHSPLFQVMFDLQQEPAQLPFSGLGARPRAVGLGTAKFDLSLSVVESSESFELHLEYNGDLFERRSAERMVQQFVTLLDQALRSPGTPLGRLSLVDDDERRRVLSAFNDTARPFDSQATLVSLFETQVARTPDAVALVAADATLSFRELDERSTRLARHLASLGARPESVVGLCLERTSELVVALWAILKTGAAYLPLEPTHPALRRAELLRRAGARLAVTRPDLFPDVELDATVVNPDTTGAEVPLTSPLPGHLAAVMYTSGSTGEPKGVELTHRNLVHAFESFDALYGTAAGDCWAASASVAFDMHFEDVVYPLSRGARVVLREVGPAGLVADVAKHGVTHLKTTPSLLSFALDEEPDAIERLQSLSVLITGGEVLSPALVQRLAGIRARLFNSYGPTETTIISTAEQIRQGRRFGMGRPLDRSTCYVLDAFGAPVPVGVPGELFIGGEGVARGYRGNPHLTAERFLPDPFSPSPDALMYRTGDRVCWNDDGTLSFLGRADFQVKVRGVRIELEEVEAALLRIRGVQHAAVLARTSAGQTRLDAFLVAPGLASTDIRAQLSASVPEAMVPSRLTLVDALPVTSSGKVDRKALAALPVAAPESGAQSEPPRGVHEELLAQMFAQLLDMEQVGRNDDFFALGGHSLSAVQLVSRIRRVFDVELPLASVFAQPTVQGLVRAIHGAAPAAAALPGPTRRADDAPLRLSPAQERMWFLQQLRPDSPAYNVPHALELDGPLSSEALEKALQLLVERHRGLRLVIGTQDGRPAPALLERPPRLLDIQDLRTASAADSTVEERIRAEACRAFELARGPLFRFTLFRLGGEHHVLLLNFHHIVVDGVSLELLLRELGESWSALATGEAPTLRPVAFDYGDIAAWLHSEPVQARDADQLQYWQRRLAEVPTVLELPTDFPRPLVLEDRGGVTRRVRLRPELARALRAYCRSEQVTPFMALYATFSALLHRLSGQDDFCVGIPVAGRTHPAAEGVVGLFVNSLPLRTRFTDGTSFADLVRQGRETVLEAFAHQDLPFDRIVEALRIPRSLSHSPLFQVMFDLQQVPAQLPFAGLGARPRAVDLGTAKFDLSLSVVESTEGFELHLEYNGDLFERPSAERMVQQFVTLLDQALRSPSTPLGQLSLADDEERQRVLSAFNDTARPFDAQATLVSLFEEQVARTPDAVALAASDATLTFRELDERSTRLAHHLASLGARPESVVGLCLERTSELVVGLWAILKTGAAYLPLEPTHPALRRAELLRRAGARLAVTRPDLFPDIELDATVVSPDATGAEVPLTSPLPGHLAAVMYTSGSTGEPKGVELTHRNLVHAFESFDALYGTAPGDCWAAFASVAFDIHFEDLVYGLTRGATVVLRALGPHNLARDIRAHGLTHISTTPSSLLVAVEEDPESLAAFQSLRVLVSGGEVLPPSLVQQLLPARMRLVNGYGPTETTIAITGQEVRTESRAGIGRPLDRSTCYVLDAFGAPVPVGVPGELFIGGEGVTRGYRGRPDLTADRFVPDPFSSVPGARMYRTGDRVRWNDDGTLSFLGRADFQVKIRGVRIELEEVEAALLRIPGVQQASAVLRRDDAGSRLDAFVVAESGLTGEDLRDQLAARVPDAMVPTHVQLMDALPLNSSSKVDRHALARMPIADRPQRRVVEPPQGPTEALVADLFRQLLRIEQVDRRDDFFRLGGHSLSAMQLVARICRAFRVDLPVGAVFSAPTVAQLARQIEEAPAMSWEDVALQPSARAERSPLSLVQERLWYALQLPEAPPFIITDGLLIDGPLEVPRLERALRAVLERNDTLRSTFHADGDALYVEIQPIHGPHLSVVDLSHLAPEQALQSARAHLERRSHEHMELARGPLYRFELLRLDREGRRHVLAVALSHLVVDGIGTQVLLEELETAWRQAGAGDAPLLPPASLQYSDFAAHQRTPGHLARLDQQLENWKRALAGAPAVIDLPTDAPRQAQPLNTNMRTVPVQLQAEHARALRQLAAQTGVSTFTAALALMDVWLYRLAGQSKVVVAANISGRTLAETERMVGFFTNLVPLCTDVSGEPSFRQMLRRAHEAVELANANQEIPWKRIADAVHPEADRAALPLAQTLLMVNPLARSALDGLSVARLEHPGVIPAYDLILALDEAQGGGLGGFVAYDSALFSEATVEGFSSAFERLFAAATEAPDAPISRLALLSSERRAEVLSALRGPCTETPTGACVHTLFEQQVARTPDAPAVAHGSETWSYAELNARANRIARELVAAGLPPEARVGVVMDPSTQAMAVLLGILKAGCAYVPLDPGWPEQRKRVVLERAGVQRMFVDAAYLDDHRAFAPTVSVPAQPEAVPGELDAGPARVSPEQLAYIVFTSGSTGEPKGVMVQHASVVNHNLAIAKRFGLQPGDRMLQFAPLSFDAAAEDLYPPLVVGATVVMKNGLVPAHAMTPYLEEEGITVISLPPTYIEEWVREMESGDQRVPKALRLLAPGGDVLRKALWEGWGRVGGDHAPWVNVYGPTECTITSATCAIPGPEGVGDAPTFPIGRPIDGARFYLLDSHLEPVLPGLPGRVFIGGVPLARGYLNAPEQTARVFLPDPWSDVPGARMYETGDLARMEPDGRLRFLGRADHQVKIRGFRVELSEIETCLRRQEGVAEAVVMARKAPSGVQQLCAWVQASSGSGVSPEQLRAQIAEQLPEYMIPADLVVMEALPVNANGKVDRQALPAPESIATGVGEGAKQELPAVAWRNSLEMLLAQVWAEVLGKAPAGVDVDFFEVGGDSILAMRLLARIEDELRIAVPLATVFQNPVLGDLCSAVERLVETGDSTSTVVRLSSAEVPEDAPLLWFIHPGDGEVHHYRFLTSIVGERYRCFAVQAPETLTKRTFANLDERIAAYVRDLRELQPEGPYRIVTYSYGAYPALGIVRELEAQGQRVSLLALFDTLTNEHIQSLSGPVQLEGWEQMADEFGVLDDALRVQLAAAGADEQWEELASRARGAGMVAPHTRGADLARTWHVLGEVLVPEARRWTIPNDVRAPLVLFASHTAMSAGDPTLGWGRHFSPEQLRVVPFPGSHYTAIRPPDVYGLGPILLEALEAAER